MNREYKDSKVGRGSYSHSKCTCQESNNKCYEQWDGKPISQSSMITPTTLRQESCKHVTYTGPRSDNVTLTYYRLTTTIEMVRNVKY